MQGQFRPRGVMMRDCLNKRTGFDRVLMAVAATFLTVSATSAMAQADPARNSAAELAIDAAIPRPEPANVPPPTINDFKLDSVAPAADAAKTDAPKAAEKAPEAKPSDAKPSDVVTAPARPTPIRPRRIRRPRTVAPPASRGDTRSRTGQGREQRARLRISRSPTSCRDLLGSKSARYFDRKAERAAIEKFYTARDFAPLWTQGGALTATGKGVIARLKDAASDGLNPADYPVPDFAAATTPDALADADLKLTASMLDYARQAQSGRMHWSQVSADIQYPEHPIDPTEVLTNVTDRQGRLGGARQLQPAAEALSRIEGEARRAARPGRRTGRSRSPMDRR